MTVDVEPCEAKPNRWWVTIGNEWVSCHNSWSSAVAAAHKISRQRGLMVGITRMFW